MSTCHKNRMSTTSISLTSWLYPPRCYRISHRPLKARICRATILQALKYSLNKGNTKALDSKASPRFLENLNGQTECHSGHELKSTPNKRVPP